MRLFRWIGTLLARLPGVRKPPSPLLGETRLIVLDVDVTGVVADKDYAKGIAMLVVEHGEFSLDEMVYCPIAPPDGPNGAGDWREKYRALVARIAVTPVITYNPRFVEHMIKQAAQVHGLPVPVARWVDMADALYGAVTGSNEIESMQQWQERMNIAVTKQHAAVVDVFAMAQMLQTLLAHGDEVGIRTLDDLMQAQDRRVWLPR